MSAAPSDPLASQFDMSALIPDRLDTFARWRRDSERARTNAPAHLDLAYGADPTERLDVFTTPRAKAPVLVFIHGGYWRSLDKHDHSFIAPAFTRASAMVAMPNYALRPAVTIEAIVLQMVRALVWVHDNAARFGGDPQRIVVAGHSAGAHLAAMLLCCRWPEIAPALPAQLVKTALALSGIFDLEPLRRAPFLQSDLRLTPGAVLRLSPTRLEPPAGRLHAVVGGLESEEFLRQNQSIRDAWGSDAVPVCEVVAGAHHLSIVDRLAERDSRLHHLALELLQLKRPDGQDPGSLSLSP